MVFCGTEAFDLFSIRLAQPKQPTVLTTPNDNSFALLHTLRPKKAPRGLTGLHSSSAAVLSLSWLPLYNI